MTHENFSFLRVTHVLRDVIMISLSPAEQIKTCLAKKKKK